MASQHEARPPQIGFLFAFQSEIKFSICQIYKQGLWYNNSKIFLKAANLISEGVAVKNFIAIMTMLVLFCGGNAFAVTYDAVSGFSNTNPGLIWSYQASRNGAVFDIATHYTGSPELGTGWETANPLPFSGSVWVNTTGSTQTHLTIKTPTGYIGMDPEAYDWVSVTFTAPSAGQYQFVGQFSGIDTVEYQHDNQIVVGTSDIYSNLMNHYGEIQSFSKDVSLAAGQAVSFRTLTGIGPVGSATSSNLATGFQLSVTAVPEPATWAMMIVGIGMIGAMTRYRRTRLKLA